MSLPTAGKRVQVLSQASDPILLADWRNFFAKYESSLVSCTHNSSTLRTVRGVSAKVILMLPKKPIGELLRRF